MNSPENFVVAVFDSAGELAESLEIESSRLEQAYVEHFKTKFRHLSGDLELPLEGRLPGSTPFLDYRIGSDLNGASVFYYFHDEVIFASLLLSGTNEESETELMEVFRFLLLDSNDDDEPSDDEIDSVLASNAFDFRTIEKRPASFEVQLNTAADEQDIASQVQLIGRCLAAAFFAIDRSAKK